MTMVARKFVVAGIFVACFIILAIKHVVFINFSVDESIESTFRDALITFAVGTVLAIGYWKRSEKLAPRKKEALQKQPGTEFYTVPIAMSVFALYLLLFVMRLIVFIDMYAEKPFLLMLEFPIIAVVAIFLFIPFIIKKINLDNDHSDDEIANRT
jgi:hypothetical protein